MHMVTFAIVFMLFENEKNNWTEWLIKIIKFSGTPIEIGIFGKGSWVTIYTIILSTTTIN